MADQTAQQSSDASPEDRMAALFGRTEVAAESETTETVAATESETPTTDDQSETDEQAQSQEETETAAEESDLVEVEWNGKKLSLPKDAAEEVTKASERHRHWKEQTQQLADLRRHATAVADQQVIWAQYQQATANEQKELFGIENRIEEFKKVDWAALDMETYIRTKQGLDQLKDRAGELKAVLQQKGQEVTEKQTQKRAEMAKSAYDFIGKHVKEFTANSPTEKSVADYVESIGMPVDGFVKGSLAYPSVAVMAYKAMQYDKLQANKAQAVKSAQKAPPVVKPGAVSSSNSAVQQKGNQLREKLKKSGNWQDAAALFLHKGM